MQTEDFITILVTSSLIILTLVMLVILFLVRYQRRLHSQQQKLTTYKVDHERAMQNAIIDSQENERQHIATELHDNLGSLLAATRLQILQLPDSDKPQQDAEAIANMLSLGVQSVRDVSRELLPVTLKTYGLYTALLELTNQFKAENQLEIEVYSTGTEQRLPDKTALMLYRIAQELLHNGIRHADTSRMVWQLHWHTHQLKMTYRDWGKGFDPKTITKGLGLTNIHTRITLLKGTIQFENAPEAGTHIIMEIPITPH